MPAPRLITYQGRTRNIRQWSRETGIHPATIQLRLESNKPLEQVFAPLDQKSRTPAPPPFDTLTPGQQIYDMTFVRYVQGAVVMAMFQAESGWLECFTREQFGDW